jgi:PqqD family protein of HPr-rel-A system
MGPITLLYHRRSGITHMVGEAVPQILDAIDAIGPASADAVALWLGARFDLHGDDDSGSDDDMMAVIAARLEELALLGLITRVPA